MAREPVRRAGTASTQKRSREALAPVAAALGQQRRLQERMREELDTIRVIHRKVLLLSRGAAPASKPKDDAAAGARSIAPTEVATKMAKTLPLKRAHGAAQQRMEPVKQQQQRPMVQRATSAPTESSAAKPLDKAREILKRRRMEELAQAREKFRQKVLEMERAVLPDETIYPRDLLELGIMFEYAVTRTRRQAVRSRLNGGE